jgi:hypothetical protein
MNLIVRGGSTLVQRKLRYLDTTCRRINSQGRKRANGIRFLVVATEMLLVFEIT